MNVNNYKVRVLHENMMETIHENLDWEQATDKFTFYVRAALELGLTFRACNIMLGKKSIKMFTNH